MDNKDISVEIFSALPNDVAYHVLHNVINHGTTKEAVLAALSCKIGYKVWTDSMKELLKDMPKFVIEKNNYNDTVLDVKLHLNKEITTKFLNALLDKKMSVKFLWNELKPSIVLPETFNLILMLVCEVNSYEDEHKCHTIIKQTFILTKLRSLFGDSCKTSVIIVDTRTQLHNTEMCSVTAWGHKYEVALM